MTKLRLVVSLAVLALSMAAFGESRVFTESTSGKKITAEVVAATDSQVMLKVIAGSVHVLPLSRLSEADQRYVAGWRLGHPFSDDLSDAVASAAAATGPIRPVPTPPVERPPGAANPALAVAPKPVTPSPAPTAAPAVPPPSYPIDFQVRWTKDRQGKKVRPDGKAEIGSGMFDTVKENWLCHFTITNPLRTPLTGIDVNYEVRFRSASGLARAPVIGTCPIASLGPLQSVKVDTKVFQVPGTRVQHYTTSRDPQNNRLYATNTFQNIEMDEITGVILVFKTNGTEMGRYESPGVKK
jgi:hypothetical protein